MPTVSTKKTAASSKRAAAPLAAQVDQTLETDDDGEGAVRPTTLRLKELVDRVATSTGAKKKDVKEIVEATLTQLGLALHNGEMLNLPDFGKVRVAKTQREGQGSAMTLKLRPSGSGTQKKSAAGTLADPADHG